MTAPWGEDLHHAPLAEVEVGRQVAFEGRVFDTLGLERVSAVRPTGQVLARVVDTFARLAPEVLEATIAHEDGTTELLTGTPEHPVHLAAEGRYAPLRELRPGDRLTTRDGTEAVLQQVERRYGDIEVFNVEVAGQHNYLADDLLVHNPRPRLVACVAEIQPNKCHRATTEFLTFDEAVEYLQLGGDLFPVSDTWGWKIARAAGDAPPIRHRPHGPGQLPHLHAVGCSGHVLLRKR